MKRNLDPRINQQLDGTEADVPHVRGHRRTGTVTKLTALATAAAAAATFAAGCSSASGAPKAGKTTAAAAASRAPGGTSSSPETPTATPSPTERATSSPLAGACLKLSNTVFKLAGIDLGYASEADALANCKTYPASYNGYDPKIQGEAVNWAGNGVAGRVILQVVRNDADGRIFGALKSEGGQAATVNGKPAVAMSGDGTYMGVVRDSSAHIDFMLTATGPADPAEGAPLSSTGPQLFSELLAPAA